MSSPLDSFFIPRISRRLISSGPVGPNRWTVGPTLLQRSSSRRIYTDPVLTFTDRHEPFETHTSQCSCPLCYSLHSQPSSPSPPLSTLGTARYLTSTSATTQAHPNISLRVSSMASPIPRTRSLILSTLVWGSTMLEPVVRKSKRLDEVGSGV